jgi:threonine dehydrogenase-like Zn-dependent dehydrogenase
MVADKSVDVDKVITHRFPMSKYEDAFKTLFSGAACKIVMDPSK